MGFLSLIRDGNWIRGYEYHGYAVYAGRILLTCYEFLFTGHGLGSGVAAMLAIYAVQYQDRLGNIERRMIRCFAAAPTRCMSLNLAVKYADVINSVVLQFPLSTRDVLEGYLHLRRVDAKGPRRLYPPGRLYHIVDRRPFRIGRYPPVVRTAVPVDGRFERIFLTCNAAKDHAILSIHRESEKALTLMLEKDPIMQIPAEQQMERKKSIAREHALDIPQSHPLSYGTFLNTEEGESAGL